MAFSTTHFLGFPSAGDKAEADFGDFIAGADLVKTRYQTHAWRAGQIALILVASHILSPYLLLIAAVPLYRMAATEINRWTNNIDRDYQVAKVATRPARHALIAAAMDVDV